MLLITNVCVTYKKLVCFLLILSINDTYKICTRFLYESYDFFHKGMIYLYIGLPSCRLEPAASEAIPMWLRAMKYITQLFLLTCGV